MALFRTLPTPNNGLLPSLKVEVCLVLAPYVNSLKKSSQGLGLEQEAASHLPDPHYFSIGDGDSRHFGPMCLLFLS